MEPETWLTTWAVVGPLVGVLVATTGSIINDAFKDRRASQRELQGRKEAFAISFMENERNSLADLQELLQQFMYVYEPDERTSSTPGEWHPIRARIYMVKFRCSFAEIRVKVGELMKLPQPADTERVNDRQAMVELYQEILSDIKDAQDQLTKWMLDDPTVAIHVIKDVVEIPGRSLGASNPMASG